MTSNNDSPTLEEFAGIRQPLSELVPSELYEQIVAGIHGPHKIGPVAISGWLTELGYDINPRHIETEYKRIRAER